MLKRRTHTNHVTLKLTTRSQRQSTSQQGHKGRKDRAFRLSDISLCGLCDLAVKYLLEWR
jgi:hypothetical protein